MTTTGRVGASDWDRTQGGGSDEPYRSATEQGRAKQGNWWDRYLGSLGGGGVKRPGMNSKHRHSCQSRDSAGKVWGLTSWRKRQGSSWQPISQRVPWRSPGFLTTSTDCHVMSRMPPSHCVPPASPPSLVAGIVALCDRGPDPHTQQVPAQARAHSPCVLS